MRGGAGFWIRVAFLAALDAFMVFGLLVVASEGQWIFFTVALLMLLAINWVYLSPRTSGMRWLTPGLIFMVAFVAYPIVYLFYIGLTNWSTGFSLEKEVAIERLLEQRERPPGAEGITYDMFVYQDGDGTLALWVRNTDDQVFFGEPRDINDPPPVDEDGVPIIPVQPTPEELGITDADGDGVPESIGPYSQLDTRGLFAVAGQLESLILDLPQGEVKPLTTTQASLLIFPLRYTYDSDRDVLTDTFNDAECVAGIGQFECNGTPLFQIDPDAPGWRETIGFQNYSDLLTNENLRRPFLRIFSWNIIFAVLSVVLTLGIGLILAIALDHEKMGGQRTYRSILILPYAFPPFLTILIWRGLLNENFGQVNEFLSPILSDPIAWLGDPFWAKVAILLVNSWLGFPYMFLIVLGALQAVPKELQEAARVDGASGFRVFWRVTFPLMMVSIAPLLIGSFAFNFNNFILIFLLTNGGPAIPGEILPVGETDILISFTFDLAVQSGRGQNFGVGAAVAFLIFIIVAAISAFSFRFTKRLEEIYGSV